MLADALAYAVATLQPAVVVDVATLTGAMKVALGQQVGGFFANRDALAERIADAGTAAGEPLWRFPLAAVYEDKIASKVADADNAGGGPGAITAALFLQHFVGDVPWAHLDVASVGDSPDERFEWTTGPTGFGARALLAWLGGADPLDGILTCSGSPSAGRSSTPPRASSRTSPTSSPAPPTPASPGCPGLRFKTWRVRRGEWFEGTYVFATDERAGRVRGGVPRRSRRRTGVPDGRQPARADRGVRRGRDRRGLGRLPGGAPLLTPAGQPAGSSSRACSTAVVAPRR